MSTRLRSVTGRVKWRCSRTAFPNQDYDVVKGPAAIIQVYFHSAAVPPEIDPLMKYAVDRAAGAVRVSC